MKTGLVLEGGGVRGIYTAGVLDVFMEHGVTFDGVIGVSAGAIHGCSYLANQKGRSIRYYKKYCNDPRFMSFKSWMKTGDIVGADFCYRQLPDELDVYDHEAFYKNTSAFFVTCSNVETGKAEYIPINDMKTQIDFLRASASLPYFSRIVEINGKKYLDGGCTDSIPIEAFLNMGYEKNVVVLTREDTYHKKPETPFMTRLWYHKFPEFTNALLNRHNSYNQTVERILELEKKDAIFVIRPKDSLNIGRMEKDPVNVQRVYDIGYADGQRYLNDMLEWLKKSN